MFFERMFLSIKQIFLLILSNSKETCIQMTTSSEI